MSGAAIRGGSGYKPGAIGQMRRVPLVIHERKGRWARQLRPSALGWPARLVESRSASALARALASAPAAVGLVDLGDRPRAGLEDLDLAARSAPEALILVLDPGDRPGVALLARELGAAHVLGGTVPPPTVVGLIDRWVALALRRAEAAGWPGDADDEIPPGDWLARLLRDALAATPSP
jgi:hypothetical protein